MMPQSLREPVDAFFRWAEGIAKTDLRYLIRGGLWLTLGQVSISILAFLLSVAFAHFVPKETYGTYRYLVSVFWSLTALGLSGIPTALSRAIARNDNGAYRYAFKLSLLGSIPMALVSFALAAYYVVSANMLLGLGCLVIGLLGPFMQAVYLYGAVLEGKKAFKENAFSGILLNLLPTLCIILLMLVTEEPLAFLTAYLGVSVLTGALISLWFARKYRFGASTPESRKDFRSLGLHLSLMNVLATLSQQADKLLVFHALGPVQLAIYTFAVAIPDQLKAVLGNLETLSFAKFTRRHVHEILPNLGLRLWGLTGLVTLMVIVYIFAAPLLFRLLFPAYTDSILFSQIYALSLIPIGSIVPASILQAQAAKKELYMFNTGVPIFQIGALFVGITFYGLLGAIVARIATRFLTLFLSLFLVHLYARNQG